MSDAEPKLFTQEVRYMLVVDRLVLPVEFRELRAALAKNGYELSPVRNLPPPPTRIIFSGEIARKKETVVVADSDGEIGVVCRSTSEAADSFKDLIKIVTDEIAINLYERVKYFEVSAHFKLDTGKIPLKEIPKAENKEVIKKFSDIIGENLSTFSIRLSKKEASIYQLDWVDIVIEPDLVYESYYHAGVVFRNPAREKTEAFVGSLESNLIRMVKLIEA